LINEKLKKYKEEFGLDDNQDLLAMVAFDCMVESLETNAENIGDTEHIKASISNISAILSKVL
jgi:cell division protein ZapA